MASIIVVNNDSHGNNITVYDRNNNDAQVWQGYIDGNSEWEIKGLRLSDASYCNISIFNHESKRKTDYSLLHEGDRVNL